VPAGSVPPGYRHVFDGIDSLDQPVALVHEDSPALRRMAVFDVVVNNADRKGGHVLAMPDGHRYGVDHGIAFHHEPKLRSVLWGWTGEPLTDDELDAVRRLEAAVRGPLGERLRPLLSEVEVDALARRCRRLASAGVMPAPRGEYPAIPWPPF
jgi:uncharacterized repeat protein (TIGR03843 family)